MLRIRTENILTYNNIALTRQKTIVSNITRQLSLNKKLLTTTQWNQKDIMKNKRIKTYGLFGSIFGRQKSEEVYISDNVIEDYDSIDTSELLKQNKDLNEDKDESEIVLLRVDKEDGTTASIIFKIGGTVDIDELDALYVKVGWPRREKERLALALENSYLVTRLILRVVRPSLNNKTEELLVGLARATSDCVFNATLWDIMIDPDYQGRGFGKALVENTVRTLNRREISNITLFADKKVIKFYKQLGFQADPDGIKGMFWYPPYYG